jgi:uncharacterized glyoxalase superfamily protein PhnB
MQIIPYLHFKGNCGEAFKFYEKVLGGKIESLMPYEGHLRPTTFLRTGAKKSCMFA